MLPCSQVLNIGFLEVILNFYFCDISFQERKGPKLDSEELSLRGGEEKYLNSLM